MLARLRVQNFQSLRDEQRLDLEATPDRTLLQANTHTTTSNALPHVLRSAFLFGANGWGKSSVLQAACALRSLVLGEQTEIRPFLLDGHSQENPTSLSLEFFLPSGRCRYDASLLHGQVEHEELVSYTSRRPTVLFTRKTNPVGETYHLGARLPGDKVFCQRNTDRNTLFLANYLKKGRHLQELKAWFANLVSVNDQVLSQADTGLWERLRADPQLCARMADFLGKVGTGIVSITFPGESQQPSFGHGANGAGLAWELESDGTKKLVALLARVFSALDKEQVLLVDGVSNLHPLVLRRVISLFHGANNPGHAQLVLATQDTSLLQIVGSGIRRDQVWFVERTEEQTSELFSLSSCSPRKMEAVERRYFQGQYGALPVNDD